MIVLSRAQIPPNSHPLLSRTVNLEWILLISVARDFTPFVSEISQKISLSPRLVDGVDSERPIALGNESIIKGRSWDIRTGCQSQPMETRFMLLGFAAQHQETTACRPPCATARVSTLPTSTRPAQQLMEDVGKDENSEKESPPLQIDPKWYVRHDTSLALTAELAQFPRCSQILLPTHQDRRLPPRLLHHVQARGNGV